MTTIGNEAAKSIFEPGGVGPSKNIWQQMDDIRKQIEQAYDDLQEKINNKQDESEDQLSEVLLNVKTVGAKGDGITDDTVSIQNAIDSVSAAGGGVVFFPKGTYIITPLYMKPNVTLEGAGIDVSVLRLSDTAPQDGTDVRMVSMNNNTAVRHLTCNGNYEHHIEGSEHMHCIFLFDVNNVLIEDCKLTNARGDGVSISGSPACSNYVTVQNCVIAQNHRAEIVVEQVNHLKILNNFIDGINACVHFEPFEETAELHDAVISGNTMKSPTESYVVALRGDALNYSDITFSDNFVDAPNGHLLLGWVKNVNIMGNNFVNLSRIYAWYYTEKVTIIGNQLHATQEGINIGAEGEEWSYDYLISDNEIVAQGVGIYLKGAENVRINGNRIFGSGANDGVYVWSTKDVVGIQITDNYIKGFENAITTDTFDTSGISDLTIDGNYIVQNPLNFKGKLNGVQIRSNIFIGNGLIDCITVFTATTEINFLIEHNYFKNWKRALFATNYGSFALENVMIVNNQINTMAGIASGVETGAPFEFRKYNNIPKNVMVANNQFYNILASESVTYEGTLGGGNVAVLAKDSGAIGDGLADDTAPVQNAIDKVSANGGGTIFFDKGTYLLQSIKVHDNVRLQGAGRDVTVFLFNPATVDDIDHAVFVDLEENSRLEDVTVDGNTANVTSRTQKTISVRLNYANNVTIEHCKIIGVNDAAIQVKGTLDNARIVDNLISGPASGIGIHIWSTDPNTNHILIEGNEISGVGYAFGTEVYGTGSIQNVMVRNNVVMYSLTEIDGPIDALTFEGNTFVGDGTQDALYFFQTGNQTNLTLVRNIVRNWKRAFFFRSYDTSIVSRVLIAENILTDLTGVSDGAVQTGAPIEFYATATQPQDVTIGQNIIKNYQAAEPISIVAPYALAGELDGVGVYVSNGTPEAAVMARIGSLCVDKTGGKLYVKETGAGLTNTGWVVK